MSLHVERVAADEVDVTFTDEPGDDTTVELAVAIGPRFAYNTVGELTPVAGTPAHAITLRVRSDLRVSYVFRRRGATGEVEQVADASNPAPRFSACAVERYSGASVAVLPDAVPLPWLDLAEARPAAAPSSEVLGGERRIWVSLPPVPISDPVPFVVHLDGTEDHSAPSVRDALVDAGRIRPCAVVLVEQSGTRRDDELRCDPAFSRMLADELLPWLRRRHPLSADPADVALAGESFGGLCAAWTALHHPSAFGQAIIQSPSHHPTLVADLLAAAPAPIRIFHDVGELEGSLTHSRQLDQILRTKGYDTRYVEFAGGHDYAWWRGLFADALLWCFPPGAR